MTNYSRYAAVKNGITGKALLEIILDDSQNSNLLQRKYKRYKAEKDGVPIFSRTISNDKINSQVNNDFFSEIVDTKVGYMVGVPITYQTEEDSREFQELLTRNNIDDLDADTVQMSTICGKCYRLCYVDSEGFVKINLIDPWEIIEIYDVQGTVIYSIRYYKLTEDITAVDIYSEKNREHWIIEGDTASPNTDENGNYIFEHLFQYNPMIKFQNNKEEQGDCDKVLELIDSYDRAFSDVDSEIEQMRLAYLAFYGVEFESGDLDKIRQTGAVTMPIDSKAEFITKDLNDAILEHKFDRTEKNILRFANSANFTDNKFATSSGIALRYKLLPLENKVKKSERKFSKGLRDMFKVLTSFMNITGNINYLDIDFIFTRNVPIDILDEAEATNKLKGYVSETTRLGQLTFVTDVDKEKQRMEEDMTGSVDFISVASTEVDTDDIDDEEDISQG